MNVGTPPVDGVNGWVIGLAVSSLLACASAVWSEFQRRSERADKKEQEKTVAEISTAQKRAELEYQSVKDTIASQALEITSQRTEIREMKREYLLIIEELRKEREHSRHLQAENTVMTLKVATLESRIAQLERMPQFCDKESFKQAEQKEPMS